MEGKEKSKKGGTIKKVVLTFLATVVITGVLFVIFTEHVARIFFRLEKAGIFPMLILLNCIPVAAFVLCMVWKNQEQKRAAICKIIAIITGIIMVVIDEILIVGMLLS